MASCAFFGHRSYDYSTYKEQIKKVVIDLIENKGVTEFYSGCRGDFDKICADIVCELKERNARIKLLLVLAYHPDKYFVLSDRFDGSVYLLEERVPSKFAISRTNRKLVELADFVISGAHFAYGGAYDACRYAKRLNKVIEIKYES